jgi:hypothetical protein
MQRILIGGLAALALCFGAWAQPVSTTAPQGKDSSTNFRALAGYPDPSCTRAGALPKKPATVSNMEVDRYNALLTTYNKTVHAYVVCVNAYVRNADNDMDVIRKKARDAVEEANR